MTIPSYALPLKYWHHLQQSQTHLPRHELWMTTRNPTCEWSLTIFRMYLLTHWRKPLLQSYNLVHTWSVGVAILFLTTATVFIGYVLPWGQISFWGATVISNLLSAVTYIRKEIVQLVRGGFAVDNATLTWFFALHFPLPFTTAAIAIIHLVFLHQTGSNTSLGLKKKHTDKIQLHSYSQ